MTLVVGNPTDAKYSDLAYADPLAIYLIVNGTIDMSDGKIASQSFQLAVWLTKAIANDDTHADEFTQWRAEGSRTITRVATTDNIWERIIEECDGLLMHDDGLTEVDAGQQTVFCSWPVRRSVAPKLFGHKKVPLL